MTLRLALMVAVLCICFAMPAHAHEIRPAYLEITERDDGVADVVWKQPASGLTRLIPRIEGGLIDGAPDHVVRTDTQEIRRWAGIRLPGGSLGGQWVRIDGLDATITDVLVLVRPASGETAQRVLTPAAPAFVIDSQAGIAVGAYLELGVTHILTGPDHLLFVLGLLLLSHSVGSLFKTITAFTVAHSLTLAASALKLLQVPPQQIEAAVALSVVFVALELMAKERGKGGVTQTHPWIIAFGFGLLHGAAFSGVLKQVGLPLDGALPALFLFNVGVEIGQIVFVGAVLGLLWLARRARWQEGAVALARVTTIYAIGSLSTVWFFERITAAVTGGA